METPKSSLALRACLSNIRKLFLSPAFLLACIGCAAALFITVFEQLPDIMSSVKWTGFPPGTVEKLAKDAISSDAFYFVLPLLSALPQASSFLTELESGFCRSALPRCGKHGKHRYLLKKFFSCILTGGAAPVVGYLLFCLIISVIFPESGTETEIRTSFIPYLRLFCFGAFCAEIGMTASVCFGQSYTSLLSPFVICFFPVILRERYFDELFVIDPRTWLAPEAGKWICGEYGPVILMGVLIVLSGCLYSVFSRKRLSRL